MKASFISTRQEAKGQLWLPLPQTSFVNPQD
jgi:hypothetical protein